MLVKLTISLITLLSLSACAVMNESECITADWRTVGLENGLGGKSAATIGGYRKACAEYGVTPDLTAFNKGHLQGLKQFCSPQSAYQLGTSGQPLPTVCPANIHSNYLSQHDKGLRAYCTADTAFRLGKDNAPYPHICPQDLRKKLTFSFNQGQKVFEDIRVYQGEITAINTEITELDNQINALEIEKNNNEKQLAAARAGIASSSTSNLQKVIFYEQKERLKDLIDSSEAALWELNDQKAHKLLDIKMKEKSIRLIEQQPARYLAN